MIVGLTGGIGSGKTTVANCFAEFSNVAIYIADVEAKKLMNSSEVLQNKMIQEFGEHAYIKGKLNRSYLSEIVFKNKNKLESLNAIVHPEVRNNFLKFVSDNQNKSYILYENAILFESNSHVFCDVIITVTAALETRIDRVMFRDKVDREAVLNRMKNQWDEQKKVLLSNYIILNDDLEKTKNLVKNIHKILTEKSI